MTPTDAVLTGLVDELAKIVRTYADAEPAVAPGRFPEGRQWVLTLNGAGQHTGTCSIVIDYAGAEALARLLGTEGEQLSDTVIGDALRSGVTQAAEALAARAAVTLAVQTVESGADAVSTAGTVALGLSIPGVPQPVQIALTWTPAEQTFPDGPAVPPGRADEAEERIENRIDVILDIDLPIVVRFGRTELPIRQLTRIGMGSVIDLGRSPDEPVELLVSDRVVAHGEVVIVGGNYGIRILDVASPSDRVRSMEGGR